MRRFTLLTVLSIGLISSGIGCSGNSSDYKKTSELKKAPPVHEHGHGEKGPHGGSVVELGAEEFHAEVVVDHDSHTLRVYVLGKDAKTAEPTAATDLTVTPAGKDALTLKAAPQKGDGDGKASVFELVDETVVDALLHDGAIHGQLRVSIGGKPFNGEIDYHLDGAHHDHKDDHKDAHKDEKPSEPAPNAEAAKPDAAKDGDAPADKPTEAAKESDPK